MSIVRLTIELISVGATDADQGDEEDVEQLRHCDRARVKYGIYVEEERNGSLERAEYMYRLWDPERANAAEA